jgi:hypothetical protein
MPAILAAFVISGLPPCRRYAIFLCNTLAGIGIVLIRPLPDQPVEFLRPEIPDM